MFHQNKSHDVRPLRCGRCATILPEEIQTFCTSCGAPFSRIHPTSSYVSLTEHRVRKENRLNRFRLAGLVASAVIALFVFTALTTRLLQTFQTTKLEANRPIEFYTYDFPEFPSLTKMEKRQAIVSSLQAFEDHFGISISNYSILENQVPNHLNQFFLEAQLQPEKKDELSKVRYWQKEIFPFMAKNWDGNLSSPLIVMLTNHPLLLDQDINTDNSLEMRHIGESGVVSGLGHPALVVASSYRILNTLSNHPKDSPRVKNSSDRIRYMAEYVIAHELGHAILGIPDFVENDLRNPASQDHANCLMHTDVGGGSQSWSQIQKRPLGQRSPCTSYAGYLEAFQLRSQAILSAKIGQSKESLKLYDEAITKIQLKEGPSWIQNAWDNERRRVEKSF